MLLVTDTDWRRWCCGVCTRRKWARGGKRCTFRLTLFWTRWGCGWRSSKTHRPEPSLKRPTTTTIAASGSVQLNTNISFQSLCSYCREITVVFWLDGFCYGNKKPVPGVTRSEAEGPWNLLAAAFITVIISLRLLCSIISLWLWYQLHAAAVVHSNCKFITIAYWQGIIVAVVTVGLWYTR